MSRILPLGLRYMIESAFWFSLMSVFVKYAGRTVPFEQIVFARSLVALVLSFVWLRALGTSPWGNKRKILFLRGFFGLGGLTCFYYAVTHIPLADATVIQYSNPVFVGILAAVVLGERLTKVEVLGALACLGGVVLIAEPSFLFGSESRIALRDLAIAVGGAIFSAMAYTTVRKLGQTEEPLVIVFWFPLVATPVILPFALTAGYVPSASDLLILLGVGVTTQIAQVRMTQGLKLESAARATAMTYLQIVFAFVWGMALFSEFPTALTIVGALIIVTTTAVIGRARRGASSTSSGAGGRDS